MGGFIWSARVAAPLGATLRGRSQLYSIGLSQFNNRRTVSANVDQRPEVENDCPHRPSFRRVERAHRRRQHRRYRRTQARRWTRAAARLNRRVSDDAIFSGDLNGVVASWNGAAQRIFGYSAAEMIGKPASVLLPPERENEDPEILDRIRRGERIEHYETVRRRKDGGLVEISLSVSPLRNTRGALIGVAKIARGITERRQASDRQQLLLRVMDHRIKNLFCVASGVVALSARSAGLPAELTATIRERLGALARAHSLTLFVPSLAVATEPPAMLHALIRTIVSPHENQTIGEPDRVTVNGADIALSAVSLPTLALLLHELTTNAAKYGALSTPGVASTFAASARATCLRCDGRSAAARPRRRNPAPTDLAAG